MKNTPSFMKSIWFDTYSPCEKTINPAGNIDENTTLKDLNYVKTKNLEKNLNINGLAKDGKLNDSSISSSPSLLKRKYENNENVKTPIEKKAKLEEIKADIDSLLGEYTMDISKVDELNITQTSSYFASSNQMSPTLTKVCLLFTTKFIFIF